MEARHKGFGNHSLPSTTRPEKWRFPQAIRFWPFMKGREPPQEKKQHQSVIGGNSSVSPDLSLRVLENLSAHDRHVPFYLLDIDHFSGIKEAFTSQRGNRVLRWVKSRLDHSLGSSAMVHRWGGDGFVLIPRHGKTLSEKTVMDFQIVIRNRCAVLPRDFPFSVSVVVVTPPATDPDWLDELEAIERYLQLQQKRGDQQLVWYNEESREHRRRRSALKQALPGALTDGSLTVCYQPLYHTISGKITGFETLCRWNHHRLGPISPDEFIPIAESIGLIFDLGLWVLEQSCRFLASVRQGENVLPKISVNVSGTQLIDAKFVGQFKTLMKKYHLGGDLFELELTESVLVNPSREVLGQLVELRSLGVSVALDDFGLGYSSLSTLTRLPVDAIKIDKTFLYADTKGHFYGAIVGIAKALGLNIVAEGVERPDQLALVKDHGCARCQGYLLSRPLSSEVALALLQKPRTSMITNT